MFSKGYGEAWAGTFILHAYDSPHNSCLLNNGHVIETRVFLLSVPPMTSNRVAMCRDGFVKKSSSDTRRADFRHGD